MDPPIEGPDDMDAKSIVRTVEVERSINHQAADNSYELFQKN